jgi:hypothetical protein
MTHKYQGGMILKYKIDLNYIKKKLGDLTYLSRRFHK